MAEEDAKAAGTPAASAAAPSPKADESMELDASAAPGGAAGAPRAAGQEAIEAAVARGPDFSALGVSLGGAWQMLTGDSSGAGAPGAEEAALLKDAVDYPSAVVLFNRAMINFKASLEV